MKEEKVPERFYTFCGVDKGKIYHIGYEKNGDRFEERVPFSPILFRPMSSDEGHKDNYRTIHNERLQPVVFSSISEARKFIKEYHEVEDFDIYGSKRFEQQFLNEECGDDVYFNEEYIRIFYIDIEVDIEEDLPDSETAEQPITAITIYDTKTEIYFVWSLDCDYKVHTNEIKIKYKDFDDEVLMLQDFVSFWTNNYPDIITGWFSSKFDIPYIVNRITRLFSEEKAEELSPIGKINIREYEGKFGKQETDYTLYGISHLDYVDLDKKFSLKNRESYKLDFVLNEVLGTGKLEYDGSLRTLYRDNPQKYIEYNIVDVKRLVEMEAKQQFLSLAIIMTYWAGVSDFTGPLGPVKYWEVIIYNHLIKKKIVPPLPKGENIKSTKYAGAYVKDPVPGLYDLVLSYDLESLYPSLIIQYNISPDTIVDEGDVPNDLRKHLSKTSFDDILDKQADLDILKDYDLSMTANKQLFKKDHQGFLAELMEQYFDRRKVYKSNMIDCNKSLQRIKEEKERRGLC